MCIAHRRRKFKQTFNVIYISLHLKTVFLSDTAFSHHVCLVFDNSGEN